MTILQLLRLFLVASALGALTLIALRPRAVWRVVGGFLGQRSYAITLGAIRIFLFTRLYMATSAIKVGPLTEAPANTRNLPPGWGWLGDIVPLFDLGFAQSAAKASQLEALFELSTPRAYYMCTSLPPLLRSEN